MNRKIFINLNPYMIKMRLYKKGDNMFSNPVMLIIVMIVFFALMYIVVQLLVRKLMMTP